MMKWLERKAIRFLRWRGIYPTHPEIGMVISGNVVAFNKGNGIYEVHMPYPRAPVHVRWGSQLIDMQEPS
jgi:hypothetical protein